jgi:hypothetical protein
MFVDDFLHSRRTGFDSEEDPFAAGSNHEVEQFFVDAVGASAARPFKTLARSEHAFAKRHDLPPIHGEHVMNKPESPNWISLGDSTHVLQHSTDRPQAELAPEEVVGRAEGAGKRTPAPQFQ